MMIVKQFTGTLYDTVAVLPMLNNPYSRDAT